MRAARDAAAHAALLGLAWLNACLIAGFAHPPFGAYDWWYAHGEFSVWRQGWLEGRLPLRVTPQLFMTELIFAQPSTTFLPHYALLRWLEPGTFLPVHLLVMTAVGYAGLAAIRRRWALGRLPFLFLYLLIEFGGYPVAHLGVGHTTLWAGHQVLPWFLLLLVAWAEDGPSLRRALLVALAIAAISLTGMFHACLWCSVAVGLMALRRREWFRDALIALLCAWGLMSYRLAPASMLYGEFRWSWSAGYSTPGALLAALTRVRTAAWAPGADEMHWWEYDQFTGWTGLALLLTFGLAPLVPPWRPRTGPAAGRARLDLPLAVLSALSLGPVASSAIARIPVLGLERAASRILVVPLALLAVLAAIRFRDLAPAWRRRPWFPAAAAGMLAASAAELLRHAWIWRAAAFVGTLPDAQHAPPSPRIVGPVPESYLAAIRTGWALSAATLVVMAWLWRRAGGRKAAA